LRLTFQRFLPGFPQPSIDNFATLAWNEEAPHTGEKNLPYPSEKQSADRGSIPNPELNPMTNPTLGRHLGRWAEVYFTTPAEQREQAVLELLRELSREERENPDLLAASDTEPSLLPEPNASEDHFAALEEVVRQFEKPGSLLKTDGARSSSMCPVCQHNNLPDQWYCGMCGFRLKAPSGNPAMSEPTPTPMAQVFEQQPEVARETVRETALPSFTVEATQEPEPLSMHAADRAPMWPLHIEDERDASTSRFKVMAVVALLAVAALVFLYQRRSASSSTPPRMTASSQPPGAPSVPSQEPAALPASSMDSFQKPDNTSPSPASPASVAATIAEKSVPSSNPAETTAPVLEQSAALKTAVAPESGADELAKARELLSGGVSPPDAGQASVWLWKAVAKNNVPAVLLLADLYARGDGVSRSCDQARILLTAALKRGSTEADQKLRELQNSECTVR
jgi:hypothetical protein